jgi:hypothetical protein
MRVTSAAALGQALQVASEHSDGCSGYVVELAANLSLGEALGAGSRGAAVTAAGEGTSAAGTGDGSGGAVRRLLLPESGLPQSHDIGGEGGGRTQLWWWRRRRRQLIAGAGTYSYDSVQVVVSRGCGGPFASGAARAGSNLCRTAGLARGVG